MPDNKQGGARIKVEMLRCIQVGCENIALAVDNRVVSSCCGGPYHVVHDFHVKVRCLREALEGK